MKTFVSVYDYDNKRLERGTMITHPKGCEKALSRHDCREYYNRIKDKEGYHMCPRGMTSYVTIINGKPLVLTGFRVRECCDRSVTKDFIGMNDVYNPVLKKSQFDNILENIYEHLSVQTLYSSFVKFFQTLKHETIYWGSEINALSERLMNKTTRNQNQLYDMALKIYHFSRMISFNFSRFDLMNDTLITTEFDKTKERVYSRFLAMIRCLEPEANKKNMHIKRHGNSMSRYSLNAEIFDMLPYVVIENAIKYSPNNEEIDVYFEEDSTELKVSVESLGPQILSEEKELIFENTKRGKYAEIAGIKGTGIGLYQAKLVCQKHDISYNVDSVFSRKNGKYSLFKNKFTFLFLLES